jgi:hypothetical protein
MNREIAALTAGPGGSARPDWVMCGCPTAGGVRLVASKDMTHAELEMQFGYQDIYDGGLTAAYALPVSRRVTLTAGMTTFVMIDAPDYPTAFRALFEQWTPGPGERVALPGIPAIEAAP